MVGHRTVTRVWWSDPSSLPELRSSTRYVGVAIHPDDRHHLESRWTRSEVLCRRETKWNASRLFFFVPSLLPYGCLATGYCSGLIEVVKNAKTIMNIQKLGGLKGQFQFDASTLYRWIAKNNPGPEKSVLDDRTPPSIANVLSSSRLD